MTNADLIVAIQALLQKSSVGTQDEIKIALQKKGFVVNQAKISRLLNQLGAVKMTQEGKTVYRLSPQATSLSSSDSFKHLILNITRNESMIVILTSPGSAQLVARFLDQKNPQGILGTLAGDDTILIVPDTVKNIQTIFKNVYSLLLG